MEILNVYTDGASRGNPEPASIGIVFKDKHGNIVWQKQKSIGETTNNEAEYQALIYAMKHVKRYHSEKARFYLKSELIMR